MLKSIFISNYALISTLEINFQPGLSVLTGETGAGKSIILGALSLILGQRADNKSIKKEEDKCVVEAVFDISAYKHLDDFFETNELDHDVYHCIIRRELTANGKSRAFINDTPVALTVLRDLTSRLIDIHSQHENLLLSNASYQLEVLDTVARNNELLQEYRESYLVWKADEKTLEKLKADSAKAASETDFIRFQFNQLQEAKLIPDEQQELEAEQETLSHIEEIKTELNKITGLLDGEQGSLLQLKESVAAMSKIAKFVTEGDTKLERIQAAYIDLKDLTQELILLQESLDYNPARLEETENRLSELYSLMQKFKVNSVEALIEKRDSFGTQLQHIDSFEEEIDRLEKKLAASFTHLQKYALLLTESRTSQIATVEQYMIQQLSQLGMPNIQFKIRLIPIQQYTENGIDQVEFLFSANKNREMQRVEEIASGGEISRLMLAIKSLIAGKSDLPTIIFDEIDTGVSGEIAHRMGEIMLQMSRTMQVITITHLPQIAAKGEHHFRVYKDDSGQQTETYIQRLSATERVDEIATMLSGKVRGEAAIQNARELLSNG
ncbi:DNA repair protein RecN [bioreactor metagenome]|jgi:DNA repair protein RecN (Recombination protein N)|uniref:DNA repair protein RecN n=1 Tax=bioreactor metagenome TaxID=1076179 RepID=A0A644W961_9ZZZZ|nr:DNA repair protein RecN [Paludibacter sp.]